MNAPETFYTLSELARKTGRPYDFWDEECRSKRLKYIQRVPGGTRLITASQYDAWFLDSLGQAEAETPIPESPRTSSTPRRSAWVEFAA